MSRFSEVARLKKSIRKNRFECIGSMQEGVDFMCDAETAMPWLLAIAEAFQPGDADEIDYAIDVVAQYDFDESTIATLRRLQKAAEEMER